MNDNLKFDMWNRLLLTSVEAPFENMCLIVFNVHLSVLQIFKYIKKMLENQSQGKLLLKVMHYNIALLHEKITNCVTQLLFLESGASYFCVTLCNLGWACLFVFLITKNPKVIIFGKCKGPFTPKV